MTRRTSGRLVVVALVLVAAGVGASIALWGGGQTPPSGPTPTPTPPSEPVAVPPAHAPLPRFRGREADRQEGSLLALAFSPDGKLLATASDEDWWVGDETQRRHTVQTSDAATGEVQYLIDGFAGTVRCLAFSPDSRLLAVGCRGAGERLTLWDVATGRPVLTVPDVSSAVEGVAFSPDGEMLAYITGADVTLWWVRTRQLTRPPLSAGRNQKFSSLAFSPNGEFLAARDGGSAVQRVVADGTVTHHTLPTRPPGAWSGNVAFAADGRTPTTEAGRWEQHTGRPLVLPGEVSAAALSPDGNAVAWADVEPQKQDDFGFLWGTPTWRVRATAELGDEWTWADAKAKLKDAPHRATRLEAVRWMRGDAGNAEAKAAMPLLEERLRHDPDWRVREKAACRLIMLATRYKDDPFPLALLEAFRDPDLGVRAAARYGLIEYPNYPPGAVGSLIESAAFTNSEETRAEALRRLAQIIDNRQCSLGAVAGGPASPHPDAPRVLDAIAARTADRHPEVKRTAHQAHSRVTGTVDAELLWLVRFQDDPDAVWPLDTPGEQDQFGITAKQKEASRNLRQLGAAWRLANYCTERPVDAAVAMLRGLDDRDPAVRRAVAWRVQAFAAVPESTVIQAVVPVYGVSEKLARWALLPTIEPDRPPVEAVRAVVPVYAIEPPNPPDEWGEGGKSASETVLPELLARGVREKLLTLIDDPNLRVQAAAVAALEEFSARSR